MQPDRNQNDWQQPAQQPAPSPAAPPNPGVQAPQQPVTPVVSLTPEAATPGVAPVQQPAMPERPQAVPTEVPTPDSTVPPLVQPPADAPQEASQQEVPAEAEQPVAVEQEPVRWQANEYIHHEKNMIWFVLFTIVVLALIAVAIFVIQSITFAILVPVMAAALLVYTHRPPRVLDYTLSRQGIHVNDHLYPFADFKAFGVIHDGNEYSVMLLPTKRFKPGVTIYFPEEAGEAIVDMLGARLPMQELHLDVVDKIIRKLRI